MKLPIKIDSDAAGQPVMYGSGYYVIEDAEKRRIADVHLTSPGGCLGTIREARTIVKAVNNGPALVAALRPFADFVATMFHEDQLDDFAIYTVTREFQGQHITSEITMGDIRRARKLLNELGE